MGKELMLHFLIFFLIECCLFACLCIYDASIYLLSLSFFHSIFFILIFLSIYPVICVSNMDKSEKFNRLLKKLLKFH